MVTPRFYNSDAAAEHYLGIRWPRAIWAAVLEQAIDDILTGPASFETKGMSIAAVDILHGEVGVAAAEWVADDVNEPRRFVWVCEQLGVSPSAVRRSIKARSRAA